MNKTTAKATHLAGSGIHTLFGVTLLVTAAAMALPCALVAQDVSAAACVPDCRDGFVCLEGACLSACNPSCPEGQTCRDGGICEPPRATPPQPSAVAVPAPISYGQVPPTPAAGAVFATQDALPAGNARWGKAAGIWGIVNAVVFSTVGVVLATTEPGEAGAIAIGSPTLVLAAVTTPLVAMGTASPDGPGLRGLRISGWIMYGLAMAGGASLLITTIMGDGPETAAWSLIPTGLAALSNLMFGIDGILSASRAGRTTAGSGLMPYAQAVPTAEGAAGQVGMVGHF
jgi:hypothetical protein